MSDDLFGQMAADSAAAAVANAPTQEKSLEVRAIGVQLVELDARIERGTVVLRDLVAQRETIMRRTLVDAMDAIGQDHMGLAEFGVDIVTGEYVHASLPNPDSERDEDERARKAALRAAGIAWLVENEHDDLIKTTVTIELPRGALADARRIQAFVASMPELDPETGLPRDNGPPIGHSASVAETIHWGTLTSFVKEQLKKGTVLPLESLGAQVGRIAKIVKRKK